VPRLPGKARLNRQEAITGSAPVSPAFANSSTAAASPRPDSSSGASQHQQQQPGHHHQQQPASSSTSLDNTTSATTAAAVADQLAHLRLHGSGEPSTSAPAHDGSANGAAGQQPAVSAGSSPTPGGDGGGGGVTQSRASSSIRIKKFHRILAEPVVDLDALRELAWSGIPSELRPLCWRLLLGYLPPNRSRQAQVLLRKRREYAEMVPEFYEIANSERSEDEIGALRQVSVDVPRTAPTVPFFQEPVVQKSLERMLYIWGIRWVGW